MVQFKTVGSASYTTKRVFLILWKWEAELPIGRASGYAFGLAQARWNARSFIRNMRNPQARAAFTSKSARKSDPDRTQESSLSHPSGHGARTGRG